MGAKINGMNLEERVEFLSFPWRRWRRMVARIPRAIQQSAITIISIALSMVFLLGKVQFWKRQVIVFYWNKKSNTYTKCCARA